MRKVIVSGLGFATKVGFSDNDIWKAFGNAELLLDNNNYTFELPYNLDERYRGISYCANMGINSTNIALQNHFLSKSIKSRDEWGVYCGTQFGGFTATQKVQCDSFVEMGPTGIMPYQSIHSGYHITADMIAIDYKIRGPNITFTSGKLAAGMALMQAFDDIRYEEVQGVVVVGVDSIDQMIVEGYKNIGYKSLPMLSSGACSIVLQANSRTEYTHEYKNRGVIKSICVESYLGKPGEITFGIYSSLYKAICGALSDASLNPGEIDLIVYTSGESNFETICFNRVYEKIFARKPEKSMIIRSRYFFGDTLSANTTLGIGTGILCMDKQAVPVAGNIINKSIKNVLVTADDQSGSAWAAVLAKE